MIPLEILRAITASRGEPAAVRRAALLETMLAAVPRLGYGELPGDGDDAAPYGRSERCRSPWWPSDYGSALLCDAGCCRTFPRRRRETNGGKPR